MPLSNVRGTISEIYKNKIRHNKNNKHQEYFYVVENAYFSVGALKHLKRWC